MESDREAMARALRRRQVREALEFELGRESALTAESEVILGEKESARVDAAVFARMSPEDAELVKEQLLPLTHEVTSGGFFGFERDDLTEDGGLPGSTDLRAVQELARIDEELAECRRLQRAFESYLAVLGDDS